MICRRATIRGTWSRAGGHYVATCACHRSQTLTWDEYYAELTRRAGLPA